MRLQTGKTLFHCCCLIEPILAMDGSLNAQHEFVTQEDLRKVQDENRLLWQELNEQVLIKTEYTAEQGQRLSGDSDSDKYESRKFKFVQRIDYERLTDFVVFIDQPLSTDFAIPTEPQVVTTEKISHRGAVFTPHVLPVMAGSSVAWPNQDGIYHNVYSISDAKPFDLGLYKNPEVKTVISDQTGGVDVFCSINSAMNCIVLVLENPYFAATDKSGYYEYPTRRRVATASKHGTNDCPPQTQEIDVPEKGDIELNFVLSIKNLPRY